MEKTQASPMPWDHTSDEARSGKARREALYERRVHASPPLRACDDERAWPATQQAIRSEREREVREVAREQRERTREQHEREQMDRELRERLRLLEERAVRDDQTVTIDLLEAALADVPPKRRQLMEARLLEMTRTLTDRLDQ